MKFCYFFDDDSNILRVCFRRIKIQNKVKMLLSKIKKMADIALRIVQKNCATVRQKILACIKIQCNIMHISLEIALNKNHYIQLSFLITIRLLGTRHSAFVCNKASMACPYCMCMFGTDTSVTSLRPGELLFERATGLAKSTGPLQKLIFPFSVSAKHSANSSAKLCR